MIVARTISEFRGLEIANPSLVPTMGALHEGHLSLIRAAAETNHQVVVSIFVNPTQFGPAEDFSRYPKSFERDCELAAEAGAAAIFNPEPHEMYPRPPCRILVPEVTARYEGKLRPGHFEGVATIVCKLFQIVQPERAFFGLKDLQQCTVISRMVADLNVPVQLSFLDTVREADGLAMSSRNAYLSQSDRSTAPTLYATLRGSQGRLLRGEPSKPVLDLARTELEDAGFELLYYDLIDTLEFSPKTEIDKDSALIAAVRLGKTRLIDNVLLFGRPNMP